MAFKHIPHTADVTIEASGASLEEAFSEAARAFTLVMTDDQVRDVLSHSLSLVSESRESLFFDYLSELVLLLDVEGFFPARADIRISEADGSWELRGKVVGDAVKHYASHGDVKAPTYHGLFVGTENGSWVVRATLDL